MQTDSALNPSTTKSTRRKTTADKSVSSKKAAASPSGKSGGDDETPVIDANIADWPLNALQALNVSAAALNRRNGTLMWMSSAFESMVGGADTTVTALCERLTGLDAALVALNPKAVKAQVSSLRCGRRTLEATLTPGKDGLVVLQLEDRAAQSRARQRHLEDREQLLFTSRMLSIGEMATTLAHEINQPIGAAANLLRGTVMRLQRQGSTDEGQLAVLQALQRATDQVMFASKVIARIREYTPSHMPKRVPVDLAALLRSCVSLLDWETEREGVPVDIRLPETSVWIQADETMMQQLFVNLMRNAIDAMRANPAGQRQLKLSARLDGSHVEVTVRDCGSGISEQAEQTLFVPFVSSKPTGTGIGLNICRSFVELHQGRLWFSRNEDGPGTSFHAALPIMNQPHST